ncbi:hypothetical protein GUJ93_ZPchr0005g15071 [Zizania palustris]|uniref:Uncharacterized protein n=1 Tax=Zizania palustris TaxID=103762 RepID=A0A8J5SCQ4_ZIZPA|nr:hypothetical protein GUJ93_ZPchr0005g15071 [Zizania palustris]
MEWFQKENILPRFGTICSPKNERTERLASFSSQRRTPAVPKKSGEFFFSSLLFLPQARSTGVAARLRPQPARGPLLRVAGCARRLLRVAACCAWPAATAARAWPAAACCARAWPPARGRLRLLRPRVAFWLQYLATVWQQYNLSGPHKNSFL